MKIYHDVDVATDALDGVRIAVLGYGSQGRAQALNLRDSGKDVVLGVREGGASWRKASAEDWSPMSPSAAVSGADIISMLVPDMAQPALYRDAIEQELKPGSMLLFSHGFNVLYGTISAPDNVDVAMVAPKSPGALVRREYELGRGVPCLVAVEQDPTGKALERALGYAQGIGGTQAGVLETTFKEETETDLFGEQAVLCGGVTELITAGFETLVNAGYQPEAAYFECLHELKLIVDLLHEGGLDKMHRFISDTAKYGDLTRGKRIVDEGVRERMRGVLDDVQSGRFAREWIAEHEAGSKNYRAMLDADLAHPIEEVGRRLRAHMPWLDPGRTREVAT